MKCDTYIQAIRLEVEFIHCSVYQNAGVAHGEYEGPINAGSVGTYFNANIGDHWRIATHM